MRRLVKFMLPYKSSESLIRSEKVKLITFHVRNMSSQDFEFAIQMTATMGWGLGKSDFEFMMELEPKGCFVLLERSEKIGIATTVSFDKIAWFGNLIVNESKRGRGAGSLVVNHAIKYLKNKGVETIGLYAYMERIPFYKRLGFESNIDFIVMRGKAFSSPISCEARQAKDEIPRIVDFDRSCVGYSREKMLGPILSDRDNLCYVITENAEITGYAAAKKFGRMAELGPVVCKKRHTKTAMDLLRSIFNKLQGMEVSLLVPQTEDRIVSMLAENGFSQAFKVERMYHGPPVIRDCIYMAESLERG